MSRRLWLGLPALAALPRPAWAHAILVQSDPAHEAEVPAGERVLTFRFNSRLDRMRSRLTLIGPDRRQTVLALLPGPDDVLSAQAVLAPGQATRADWHNDRAAFLVSLNTILQQLPGDAERKALIRELETALRDGGGSGPNPRQAES